MPKLTSKGQVTLPKRMRDHLGLKPGSEIEFTINNRAEIVLKTKEKPPKSRFDDLVGTLNLGMTTDEFMRMIRGDPDE
jgi:AbrB family looped-hinge helix DNA binding protein